MFVMKLKQVNLAKNAVSQRANKSKQKIEKQQKNLIYFICKHFFVILVFSR